jgi:hypothetical protein
MLIERRGTGGTSLGTFTRRDVVAYTETEDTRGYGNPEDTVLVVKGYQSHGDWAEIAPSLRVYSRYEGTREDFLGQATSFEHALGLVCGHPGYGYSWYGVQGRARNYAPKGWGAE